MSKQQHTPHTPETVLRLVREAGGTIYRNRAVEGTAIAFGPVALDRFISALHEESTRDLLAALKAAEASLSDYHADLEWGPYDLKALEAARAAIARAEGKA